MIASIRNRKTLADLLISAAGESPENGVGFIRADGSIQFLTYPGLLAEAETIASGIRSEGIKEGESVMIIITRNEVLVPTLWGCILAGVVPTILQPPVSFTEVNPPASKIENVYSILDKPGIILSDDLAGSFNSTVISPESIIPASDLAAGKNPVRQELSNETENLAFIQFSSGSTGDPKGIMLTHRNILVNIAAICVGLDIHKSDVMCNWMPLYHDMGLFGFHICPVFAQSNHYLIDPVEFIKKPTLWLDVIEHSGSTITGCPNFGQALLLRYLKNRQESGRNLSSLKAIVNGAEPISNRIMSEFTGKLSVSGLRKEVMMPAYGMAENTLAITFADLWSEPLVMNFNRTLLQAQGIAVREEKKSGETVELVSVGKALNDVEIKIADDDGNGLAEGMEGHIRIRGKSVTSGYINNPEATAEAFEDGWLKTGDKGFFYDGQLYITGRIKDIIFVHGQNLYAHDLENLASKHADIPYGKVIIGGSFDPKKGKDQVILFLVGSANQALCDLFLELKGFFRDTYGVHIDVFVPVRSNQVPKTSSGKIQRYKLLEDYRDGVFDEAIAEIKKLVRERE